MKDEARDESIGPAPTFAATEASFEALEYHSDDTVRASRWSYSGGTDSGFVVRRNGVEHLRLGPGYVLVQSVACGVCSTDLARRFLPFPLPQIIGHEVVVRDAEGRRFVVEINASHAARGVSTADCPMCRAGLATHCPDRVVVGIHDLPGGFGSQMLVPRAAALPVPDRLSTRSAMLIEPFAAALHAVETVRPREGETVAVLGPRRLGLLVVAALRAWRARAGVGFEILGITRNHGLADRIRRLGADRVECVDDVSGTLPDRAFDVVIDTTGHPNGLAVALRLARREVHLKSTHGQPALGVQHWTELVVDELSLVAASDSAHSHVDLRGVTAAEFSDRLETAGHSVGAIGRLPGYRSVVVDPDGLDLAIRPRTDVQRSLVCPRGRIQVSVSGGSAGTEQRPLLAALGDGVVLSSSRCGDFTSALELMAADSRLPALGDELVTHSFEATDLASALATARTPECVKAMVCHERA